MVIVEKSFPRGGIVKNESNVAELNSNIIFGASQKKVKKHKPKSKNNITNTNDADNQLKTISAELLNYETIQDGMNIMGIVKSVDQLYLDVSLPGRMTARVSALEISDAYTRATKEFIQNTERPETYKTLKELYNINQIVYGRVLEVKQQPNGRTNINMSFKPAEVHTDLNHTNIKKGFVFSGAVEEIQEHGYVIESGVRGLRTFVPLEKSQRDAAVGELVFLKVEKITPDKSASTCICKQIKLDNLKIKNQNEPNIDYILPTTIVQFKVDKQLKDGLRGSIMNEAFSAYVNEHQLSEPLALPDDYEVNTIVNARVLYVMPLTKLVYLSLNLRLEPAEKEATDGESAQKYRPGDIIEDAKVHHLGTGGVVLILKNKFKGVLSYKSIKTNYKGNYDQDQLLTKYAKKTKHKVRVLDYDSMDSLYICTDDVNILNEKIFALEDLQPGEFITAMVKKRESKVDGYLLKIGKVKGIIEKLFLAPNAKPLEEKSKVRCRVVAVNTDRKVAYLTNRAEYMSKSCKILKSLADAKANATYTGTIVKCNEDYLLIKFFDNVKGVLHKQQVNGFMSTELEHFYEGQTMKFRIASKKDEQITLTLPEDTFRMGEICPIEVVSVLESGLEIKISYAAEGNEEDTEEFKGLVPIRLLSNFIDLLSAKLRIYPAKTRAEVVCMYKNIFSIRDLAHFRENLTKKWSTLQVGDVIRAYIKNVNGDIVDLFVPIQNYSKIVKVHIKMLHINSLRGANVELAPEQPIDVKILSKEQNTKTITISAKLTDVWDGHLNSTAQYMESYLQEVANIKQVLKKNGSQIAQYSVGDRITARFQGVHVDTKDWLYQVDQTDLVAVLKFSMAKNTVTALPEVGDKQDCVVLWVDYSNDILLISNRPIDIEHITKGKKLPPNLIGKSGLNGKVLLKLDNVVICSLKKGKNPLVYCPVRLHFNDFEHSASAQMKEREFCKLAFIHESRPIAVPESVWKLWKDIKRKANEDASAAAVKRKKLKLERNEDNDLEDVLKEDFLCLTPPTVSKTTKPKVLRKAKPAVLEQLAASNSKKPKLTSEPLKAVDTAKGSSATGGSEAIFFEDKTPNKIIKQTLNAKDILATATKPVLTYLPGVSNFWTTDLTTLNQQSVDNAYDLKSGDEDDDGESAVANAATLKKKRLSATEKFKEQREEETRLRAIEEKYADPNHLPETVDQFDRLVLSDPNNSRHWINYMVFHLQSTEFDKARAVARRAIKTVSFRNENDLTNIWMALVNLELRYGTKETFDATFKEALVSNEPLKIYLRTIEILTDGKKTQELIETIGVITKKFKTEPDVWRAAGNAYFSIGMPERGQQLLHRALACLPNRDHVNTIIMFANLNYKHGNNEMAETLLDQVVTSYPKRVDVWTQYVDLLVKAKLNDSARAVLERAVMQKIPLKKMRIIFKKYLEFEERFGDDANVQKVKKMATEFVKNNSCL